MMLHLLLFPPLAHGGSIGPCEDLVLSPLPEVFVDDTCQTDARVGSFDPVVEWQWSDVQLRTTPMVANLSDDNKDGKIDEDDIPDIVFVSFPGTDQTENPGTIYVLSGDGNGVLYSLASPIEDNSFVGAAGLAVGDLEGDGSPDICVAGKSTAIICLEADLSFKWAAGTASSRGWGYPSIADMDGDGYAEVIFGAQIFDHEGTLVGQGDTSGDGDVGYGPLSIVVDIDDDGELEVIGGGMAWERDGTLVWDDGESDGYPAVGDFDNDGLPEIVRSGNSDVILTDQDGTIIWSVDIPNDNGRGGPPTVADFDGDDEPEIGVAAATNYTVFEGDGSVRWQMPVADSSSNFTGSAVFDFEGDGRAEVVYADEKTLYVYDGEHGCVLLEMSEHDSGTHWEYPVIADVDQDGSAEIILGSNRRHNSGDWLGITVIGDKGGTWMPARGIWNQHAYAITNVNDDGSIPATVAPNWLTFNSFRTGGLATGPSDWLTNFQIPAADACHSPCDGERTVDVYVTVSNSGLATGEDIEVLFYRWEGTKRVDVHSEIVTVPGGETFRVGPVKMNEDDWGQTDLWAAVNPDGSVEECDETDQTQVLGPWPFPETDADGDGYDMVECGGLDCDDSDFEVHPGAGEVAYDGTDNDCDAQTPDDDVDGDGFTLDEDCNDMDAAVNPDAEEIPDNGVDENCDDDYTCPSESYAHGGSTCASARGTATLAGLPLLVVFVMRRRYTRSV